MKESIISRKIFWAVDDDLDFLMTLEKEILHSYPQCYFDKATTYRKAREMMFIWTYDLIILNVTIPGGFGLLELAVMKRRKTNLTVVVLIAHTLSTEDVKCFFKMGAQAYLPKREVTLNIPFLQDILRYENLGVWGRLFENLRGFFNGRLRENEYKSEARFWHNFNKWI